jgi:hypothetical protein
MEAFYQNVQFCYTSGTVSTHESLIEAKCFSYRYFAPKFLARYISYKKSLSKVYYIACASNSATR